MKFCTKCGLKEQDNSAIFCKKCGNKLTSTKYHPTTREELDDLLDRDDVEYSEIDVSNITDMSYLFADPNYMSCLLANGDYSVFFNSPNIRFHELKKNTSGLIYWDVSNVEDMSYMFCKSKSFNQPIGNWDVSNVETMASMFESAISFNQLLENWDVSNVNSMSSMFKDAISFNQPIGNWDVSNVETMASMFESAISFNQLLENWDVSNVRFMRSMFSGATSFNLDFAPKSSLFVISALETK